MQVYFRSKKLQKICESERELVRKYGARQGKRLAVRLSELRAIATLEDASKIPHLNLHQLGGDRREQFALTLIEPQRLILEVAQDPMPRLEDGGIDRSAVTAVTVVEVVDYH